jgi:type III pantothenate kinase
MSDLVAITLGNTSVAMATVAAGGALGDVRHEPLARLEDLFAEFVPAPGERETPIIVASVNPPVLARLRAVAPSAPLVARDDFPIPIATDVQEPEKVGVDRLLAALAAYRWTDGACIVVDCGTAVTVDAVDSAGVFLGGAIFPGREMMARALAEGTARLPHVEAGAPPESVIGKNTEEAILAGLVHGTAGALEALIAGAMMEVGFHAHIVVTGGDATVPKSPVLRRKSKVVPDLVLEGLVMAYGEWQER